MIQKYLLFEEEYSEDLPSTSSQFLDSDSVEVLADLIHDIVNSIDLEEKVQQFEMMTQTGTSDDLGNQLAKNLAIGTSFGQLVDRMVIKIIDVNSQEDVGASYEAKSEYTEYDSNDNSHYRQILIKKTDETDSHEVRSMIFHEMLEIMLIHRQKEHPSTRRDTEFGGREKSSVSGAIEVGGMVYDPKEFLDTRDPQDDGHTLLRHAITYMFEVEYFGERDGDPNDFDDNEDEET